MRLADYIVQHLESAGIDHAFLVCGGGAIFLDDAIGKAQTMKYVACHHEQAAAIAAEAYARARTSIGLCVVTSGPGGTNAITGVAGAWCDNVPMIVISGQVFHNQTIGTSGVRTKGVQEIDIVSMIKPITKYAAMVTDPNMIRWHLDEALQQARTGRPGPVWLDIPANVQNAAIYPDILPRAGTPASLDWIVDDAKVNKVADMLKKAKRPLFHIGQGVRWSRAEREFFHIVKTHGIPFVTARNGNDLCASDHENYVGRPGTFAQRGANFAVQTCDLYIAIGTRLSLAQTGYNARDYARNAYKVMVDIDEAELDKGTVPLDLKIQGDCRSFLRRLNTALGTRNVHAPPEWLAQCKAWQTKYPVVLPEYVAQTDYVNSYHFIDVLSDIAAPMDVIVTDMGFAFQNTHQAWKVKDAQRLMTNGGLAPMGWGLPAAVGAAFALERRVFAIVGDGGLMMNVQELATIAHHRLPIKIFVLNNGGYLTMRQSQAHAFDSYMGSDAASGLSFPDFQRLARSFEIPCVRIETHAYLREQLEAFLSHDGPALCELMMDPNQMQAPKSINQRLPDGTIRQTSIEDAFPFLDPEEIAEQMRIAQ